MPYLYRHRRLDTNEIFYVGISKKDDNFSRTYENKPYQRNTFWIKTVAKTKYQVEIVAESESDKD